MILPPLLVSLVARIVGYNYFCGSSSPKLPLFWKQLLCVLHIYESILDFGPGFAAPAIEPGRLPRASMISTTSPSLLGAVLSLTDKQAFHPGLAAFFDVCPERKCG
jgi:hypothetical protein